MYKLQSCSNQKQQEDEDDIVELGDSDDDIDEQLDVWLWCLIIMFEHSYHATHSSTHTFFLQHQKVQEEDSFELGDIDDDIDEQLYVRLWCWITMFERSYHARSYHTIV